MHQITDKLCSACRVITKYELERTRFPVERMLREDLVRMLAAEIEKKTLVRSEIDEGIELRMEVYVLSPRELGQLIQSEAERITRQCAPPRWDGI